MALLSDLELTYCFFVFVKVLSYEKIKAVVLKWKFNVLFNSELKVFCGIIFL
ncbi:hypothetical protein RCH33_163 [Flavobacterium daejeonense]|nr:hypothetical protein RCH33_163 [Flavobacterium daejeonense]